MGLPYPIIPNLSNAFPLQDEFDFDARVQAGINYGRLSGDIVTGDQVVVVHSGRGPPCGGRGREKGGGCW